METMTIKYLPKNREIVQVLLEGLRKLKIIEFEEKSPYNPEFVEKIKRSEQQFKEGKYTVIDVDDLWK